MIFTLPRPRLARLIVGLLPSVKYSRVIDGHVKPSLPSTDATNQLLKTFNQREEYERAFRVFDRLVKQNQVSAVALLTIIDTCTRSRQIERGRHIEQFINQSAQWRKHLRLQTSLINMYMKFHMIEQAERIFHRLRQWPECDVIVYNAMLKGYLRNGRAERCFALADEMRSKATPDNVTYILLLNACTITRDAARGRAIHADLISTLDVQHVHLQNALIDFYGKTNEIREAEEIFTAMELRETSTYNSLMKAYLINHMPEKVLHLFEQMKQDHVQTIGPLAFKPDLITFKAVCDACDKLGLLNSPSSSYGEYTWQSITVSQATMSPATNETERPRLFYDPNSLSSFNGYRIVHTHFDLTIDFDAHILTGHVQLDVKRLDNAACDRSSTITTEHAEIPNNHGSKLVLDARHLDIKSVSHRSESGDKPLVFQVDNERESLVIEMGDFAQNPSASISIAYGTSSTKCTALQWLTKEQTADKSHPYMFSQCQAIHARSLYPCQDTPGVKSTYTAKVTCPKPLTVLMSGLQTKHEESTNTFYFEQMQPIASYLVAIAAGNLVSHDLSPRIRVWTEPSMIGQCKYEFEASEEFLASAEQLLGPYQWIRYDFLVLPPSFPYGGMENPCMNFLTPTLLAGDRSLISTIVHEMTHSWTGNLVTNENWEHFWLNEGFTSFIEAKIVGNLNPTNNAETRRFHAAQQWSDLQIAVDTWGATHPYTCLVYRLHNVDPDDAYSSVQYYKGAALLWHLEQNIVRSESQFDEFLRAYIVRFGGKILNTDDFIQFFQASFPQAPAVDWQSWLYTPGMPPVTHDFSTELEQHCRQLAGQSSPLTNEQMSALNAKQVAYLLNLLLNQPTLTNLDYIKQTDANCDMSTYSNCEIRFRWYQLCIRAKYDKPVDEIFKFLELIGRMKFVKPLYTEFKASWPEMLPRVKAFFEAHKQYMNPITVKQIETRLNAPN